MDFMWIRDMIDDGFTEILDAGDPREEDRKLDRLHTKIVEKLVREICDLLVRVERKQGAVMESERRSLLCKEGP